MSGVSAETYPKLNPVHFKRKQLISWRIECQIQQPTDTQNIYQSPTPSPIPKTWEEDCFPKLTHLPLSPSFYIRLCLTARVMYRASDVASKQYWIVGCTPRRMRVYGGVSALVDQCRRAVRRRSDAPPLLVIRHSFKRLVSLVDDIQLVVNWPTAVGQEVEQQAIENHN